LKLEVKEFAGMVAFVADGWRFGRLQIGQAVETVAAQDAGECGEGDLRQHGADLGVGAPGATQLQDLRFEDCGGLARLTPRS
jgi:hypothetical protein